MRHVVIMAGGSGQRFWPLGRERYPKQFLTLYGNRSLFQHTYRRAQLIAQPQNIYVSTRSGLEEIIRKQIPSLRRNALIVEPMGRDTAPSIALSCLWIMKRDPEATLMFLPADHYVYPENRFAQTLSQAWLVSEKTDGIVIVGIDPTFPSTGYGYIQCSPRDTEKKQRKYSVLRFREKPNSETAKRYLEKGNYFWNSGIFIGKVKVILSQIQYHAPLIFKPLERLFNLPETTFRKRLKKEFGKMPKISFDYAVMEKSKNIAMLRARFQWNDLGSWSSLERLPGLRQGDNIRMGQVLSFSSRGNIVSSGRKLSVLIDVNNLVIAQTDDALLVCRKESAQKVREAVKYLKKRGLHSYL